MLKKLYIELSSKCNLNCKMCFRNLWFDEKYELMRDATVERVKESIAAGQFQTVFFGGMGEPLTHPRLPELIHFAHVSGKKTELITNATLLSPDMAESLVNAGLDCLWVSLDGFSKQSYEAIRRGSMFDLITKNLADFNAVRRSTLLGITFVLMKENEHELGRINAFADSVGADFINLSHVIPGAAVSEADTLYNKDYPVGRMRRFTSAPAEKTRDKCPFISDGCCFIRPDGEVIPCMQLLHNCYTYLYTEQRKVYSHSFGNINEKGIEDIWNDAEYADFRKRVTDFDFPCCTVCLGCDDRLENKTDCMYNQNPTCGACLWAQGLIRCP